MIERLIPSKYVRKYMMQEHIELQVEKNISYTIMIFGRSKQQNRPAFT